jgi:CDP-diacylglycerol--serine O-phosphatidyltransferase
MRITDHIPNFLTLSNLFTGGIGIVMAFNGDYTNSIFFIFVAAGFDFLDGFAARYFGTSGELGKQLDSLADMVSFGVLPSIYMYQLLRSSYESDLLAYAGLLIAVFSAARLAKFNIDDRQSDKFIGVPTPANAVMICSVGQLDAYLSSIPYFYLFFALASCFLLIAPVEMIALKFKNYKWQDNISRFLLIVCIVVLFGIFQLKALPFVVPVYIVISLFTNFRRATQS